MHLEKGDDAVPAFFLWSGRLPLTAAAVSGVQRRLPYPQHKGRQPAVPADPAVRPETLKPLKPAAEGREKREKRVGLPNDVY